MNYYTERNDVRNSINSTYNITNDMYYLLLSVCEKYYNNIIWKYHKKDVYNNIIEFDSKKFNIDLKFEIPELFRYDGIIVAPNENILEYNQYSLLDFIEFISRNIKDTYEKTDKYNNRYFILHETTEIFNTFRDEINSNFIKFGLCYNLTIEKNIERTFENNILISEVEKDIKCIDDNGLKDLVKNEIELYKIPNNKYRNDSIEKIWDALERLKTYYKGLDKKKSLNKILYNMSNENDNFRKLFNNEFRTLTDIGNNYRIRHHERNKIDIIDDNYYDYLFNRCLSLISLALKYI